MNEADLRALVEPIDYEAIDPGIRDTVRLLREHGFETTDSGDGVTKLGSGWSDTEAMPFPHVACHVTRDTLFAEADRLATVLLIPWSIQASYDPRDKSYVLLATLAALLDARPRPPQEEPPS